MGVGFFRVSEPTVDKTDPFLEVEGMARVARFAKATARIGTQAGEVRARVPRTPTSNAFLPHPL